MSGRKIACLISGDLVRNPGFRIFGSTHQGLRLPESFCCTTSTEAIVVRHWKRTSSFHPFIQSRSVRIIVLFVTVLTFMPFDMVDDYHFLVHFEPVVSSDTGISKLAGECSCDSHHECGCLLCNAITANTGKVVIYSERYAWDLEQMSPDFFASTTPFEVFRPPRV